MSSLRPLFCLLLALLCLQAGGQEVPVFPSRLAEVSLRDTEGKEIRAVIHNVWPHTRSTRIFVPEQRDSFDLLMETFDKESQGTLQDWFFKDQAYSLISIKIEENLVGRLKDASISSPESLPKAPVNAINAKASDSTRNKDISAEIRNNSAYDLENLSVVFALRVARDIKSTSPTQIRNRRLTAYVYSERKDIAIPAHSRITLNSDPVPLTNYTLRYDIETFFDPVGQPAIITTNRYRIAATDRIIAYYVLVLYKGEIVAAELSHRYLANKIIENLAKADKIKQEADEPAAALQFAEEAAEGSPEFLPAFQGELIRTR